METQQEIVRLDPSVIVASRNIRHSLTQANVDRMADSILDVGGVQEPVTVEMSPEGEYRLLKGFYRHAAVTKLNAEQNAGLTLPAIVLTEAVDPVQRLKLQVAENVARAALSPMDTAVSIKALLDAGVSRSDIRKMFPRTGGRKGSTVAPASNAWVNIMLNLLELPKGIQGKIHEGLVTVAAAYELGKVEPSKRADVLAKAEAEVQKELASEEKDEGRFLKLQQKADAEAAKARQAAEDLAKTKADIKDTATLVKEKTKALVAARTTAYDADDAAAKKAWQETFAAAEKDLKAAKKLNTDATNRLAKLTKAATEAKESVAKAKEEVEAEGEKGGAKAKAVGPGDIKKAAKAEGAAEYIALSAKEAIQAFKDVSKASEVRIAAIGAACLRLLSGELTSKMLVEEMETILTPRVKKAAAGKA